jgi:hypothetical protein
LLIGSYRLVYLVQRDTGRCEHPATRTRGGTAGSSPPSGRTSTCHAKSLRSTARSCAESSFRSTSATSSGRTRSPARAPRRART